MLDIALNVVQIALDVVAIVLIVKMIKRNKE